MDPFALAFYAVVCALLGLAGPGLGAAPIRLAVGPGVGVMAALILPYARAILGPG